MSILPVRGPSPAASGRSLGAPRGAARPDGALLPCELIGPPRHPDTANRQRRANRLAIPRTGQGSAAQGRTGAPGKRPPSMGGLFPPPGGLSGGPGRAMVRGQSRRGTAMPLTIATWNINSVRLRADLVARFLAEAAPDILCLQEIKTPVDKFPTAAFAEVGYPHLVARGQKGYNGVAILARVPIEDAGHTDFCALGDARHVAARLADGTILHNLYIPAGGDEPDPEANPKFAHKLKFLAELADWGAALSGPAILVGDLNIAPRPDDVWSHKDLLKVVSHTPVEVAALARVQAAGGWTDVIRDDIPEGQLYSWWSYRAADWDAADRGRRLDHIWARGGVTQVPGSSTILRPWRGQPQPSDHVPVLAGFEIG